MICPTCKGRGFFVVPVPAEYLPLARTFPPPRRYEPIKTMEKRCQRCWGKGRVAANEAAGQLPEAGATPIAQPATARPDASVEDYS